MPHKLSAGIPFVVAVLPAILVGCGGSEVPTGDVSGTITVNGEPREDVFLKFVPVKHTRPAVAKTDSSGNYSAQFTNTQSGVPLGRCVVELAVYAGDGSQNLLPPEFHENAADNPDLNVEIFRDGLVFDYDIEFDGELPPNN